MSTLFAKIITKNFRQNFGTAFLCHTHSDFTPIYLFLCYFIDIIPFFLYNYYVTDEKGVWRESYFLLAVKRSFSRANFALRQNSSIILVPPLGGGMELNMTAIQPRFCFLSGNALKIIAAICMLCDHVGMFFFPKITVMRIIGRLAFPIFAFMIAEGAAHTKNKLRYLSTVALIAVALQTIYFLYEKRLTMCVFVTFTFALILIFLFDLFKNALFDREIKSYQVILYGTAFIIALTAIAIFNNFFFVEYGFWGCVTPLLASLFRAPKQNSPRWLTLCDRLPVHVIMCGVGLLAVALTRSQIQFWALFAIPLLLLYSGKRGRLKLKYFFYVFYPAHLGLLELINMLIK